MLLHFYLELISSKCFDMDLQFGKCRARDEVSKHLSGARKGEVKGGSGFAQKVSLEDTFCAQNRTF
jgi:hypothetical protein